MISGDLLSAVIWSWFAASESHNRVSQNQAGIVENPGLSYGLFHASVSPIYSWGVARKVGFPGVNMDIAHVRNLTWAKDSDKSTWVNYNRMRGQYMSGLEGGMLELFFNSPAQCNLAGAGNPVAGLPDCPQGISAVKAIALASAQGQKIYTITQSVYHANPNIVSSKLAAHSQSTQDKVQQALDSGYEVTIHESPIMESGWTGAGYSMIDPNTGAGGYLIDGGGNGGWYSLVQNMAIGRFFVILLAAKLSVAGLITAFQVMAIYYVMAIGAVFIFDWIMALYFDGGDVRSCGVYALYCEMPDQMVKITAMTTAIFLISAGLSGNISALILGALLLNRIFKTGGS